jgi:hypothetical protein
VAAEYGDMVRVHAVDGGGHEGLTDDEGHARSAYGITEDALVLVRPDNDVALIARATDHGAVADHLDRTALGRSRRVSR